MAAKESAVRPASEGPTFPVPHNQASSPGPGSADVPFDERFGGPHKAVRGSAEQ